MIITQEKATEAIQAGMCCSAALAKTIANRLKAGLDATCQINEYRLISTYLDILNSYQWGPNCSCSLTGEWWVAGGFGQGRMVFDGAGGVTYFLNSSTFATGTYVENQNGSISIVINDPDIPLLTMNITIFPTNGQSFFNEACTLFDSVGYILNEEIESTAVFTLNTTKYQNVSITVDGTTIFTYSAPFLDVGEGELPLFIAAFNSYMQVTGGAYIATILSSTSFQINAPGIYDGLTVQFVSTFATFSTEFAGGESGGYEESRFVLSNCTQAATTLTIEEIDFSQQIILSVYSTSSSITIAEIIVPGGTVSSMEELVQYFNDNLQATYIDQVIWDGTTLTVIAHNPSIITNPVILSYTNMSAEEIISTNQYACTDQDPPADCTEAYNCLSQSDLIYIVRALDRFCSIYNCC